MIILTIGHSTRTIEEFIGLLLAHYSVCNRRNIGILYP